MSFLLSLAATVMLGPVQVPALSHGDYEEALRTADQFLHVWRSRDFDSAAGLFVPGLTAREEDLRMEVIGLSNPHHAAYLLERGLPESRTSCRFTVRLAEEVTGQEKPVLPLKQSFLVKKQPGGKWAVASLPSVIKGRARSKGRGWLPSSLAAVDEVLEAWASRGGSREAMPKTTARGTVISAALLTLLNRDKSSARAYEVPVAELLKDGSLAAGVRLYRGGRKAEKVRWLARPASDGRWTVTLPQGRKR